MVKSNCGGGPERFTLRGIGLKKVIQRSKFYLCYMFKSSIYWYFKKIECNVMICNSDKLAMPIHYYFALRYLFKIDVKSVLES